MKRKFLVPILTLGVFSIINTEMGVIGILPLVAETYQVSLAKAGLLVSLFALAIAFAGPTMPLLFSGMNRKYAMLLVLGLFSVGTLISAFTESFTVLVAARVIPAFFHPIYCSLAFSEAAASVSREDAPKAVAKVMMGVSAGMVLGVPVVSYIANATSLRLGMLSFSAVTILVLLATIFLIPSIPVREKLSYGSQLRVLKKTSVWLAIAAVVCLNGAIFGVYSYFAGFLENVTGLSGKTVSILLLIYGLANIVGNMVAGRQLSRNAAFFCGMFPFLLGAVYLMLWFTGQLTVVTAVVTLVWGVLAGAGGNINQYLLMSAAPEAPDFANGLFLTSTNLGTFVGATVCGWLISGWSVRYCVWVGLLFLILYVALFFINLKKQSTFRRYHEPV